MQHQRKLWPMVSVAVVLALSVPTIGSGQSRGLEDGRHNTGVEATNDPALPGSGQMHEEDRTGSTGPSGTRSTSPTSGAIDASGRVTKGAGDSAVTENDRELVSRVRVALSGNPNFPVTEESLHLKADNGIIHLHGWVASDQEREAMASTVRELAGVQGVVNHLQIRTAALEPRR